MNFFDSLLFLAQVLFIILLGWMSLENNTEAFVPYPL